MNTINNQRGETVRAALLSVARACAARSLPLPPIRRLGSVLGIHNTQVCRHLARLRAEGAFVQRLDERRRAFVQEVRP